MPESIVKSTYNAYWQFIRTTIQLLPLKENLEDEQFQKLETNFNIPSLGKLYCNIDRYKGVKKKFQCIKDLREKYGKC